MRFSAVTLAIVLYLPLAVRAEDATDAKAIVAKSIKAIGAKTDDKPVAMTWKDKGKFMGGGFEMPYTGDWAYQGPDKYRFAVAGDFNGMKIDILVVVNGDKAWESGFGKSQEMTGEKKDQTLLEVYQFHVLSLGARTQNGVISERE